MEPKKKPKPIPLMPLAGLGLMLVAGGVWMYRSVAPPSAKTSAHDAPEEGQKEGQKEGQDAEDETSQETSAHVEKEVVNTERETEQDLDPTAHFNRVSESHGHVTSSFLATTESTINQFWEGLVGKARALERLHYENERLTLENANLRRWAMASKFACQEQHSKTKTRETSSALLKQTGTPVGRALASLDYRPPMHLLPGQLYTLGVSYFNGRDDEKAAVIFSYLTEMEDQPQFKSPSVLLIAGVSWYRLQNLKMANRFFDRALQAPETESSLRYLARARLWKAVVAHRLGSTKESQKWMRNLVVNHPHSTEAGWVNRRTRSHRSKNVERKISSHGGSSHAM